MIFACIWVLVSHESVHSGVATIYDTDHCHCWFGCALSSSKQKDVGGMPSFRRAMHSFEEVARGCGETLAIVGTVEHGGGSGILGVMSMFRN